MGLVAGSHADRGRLLRVKALAGSDRAEATSRQVGVDGVAGWLTDNVVQPETRKQP